MVPAVIASPHPQNASSTSANPPTTPLPTSLLNVASSSTPGPSLPALIVPPPTFTCDRCRLHFHSVEDLNRVSIGHEIRLNKINLHDLPQHIESSIPIKPDSSFRCLRCDITYANPRGLRDHLRRTSSHRNACFACFLDFHRASDLQVRVDARLEFVLSVTVLPAGT